MANQHGKNYVVANWKMNLLAADSKKLASAFKESSQNLKKTEMWVSASFTAIPAVSEVLKGSPVKYGAQNVYAPEGAFTGEVSVSMLKEFGCTFAVVGHSERRHVFGESDDLTAKRASIALQNDFTAIFCIGETLSEREAANTEAVLARQMNPLIESIKGLNQALLLIAYEPVWAIGTGKVATLDEINGTHSFIQEYWQAKTGSVCPTILYGGSVTPDNFGPIIKLANVGGALVGGASLKHDKFAALVAISEEN